MALKYLYSVYITLIRFIIFITELMPPDLEKELKNLYMSMCELLRHFWACFPPTTTALEEKAVHMHEALHRFHSARLKPFEASIYMIEIFQIMVHLNR